MSAITKSPYALEPTPAIHLTKRPRTLTFGKAGIPKATPIGDETPHREQSTTWAGQARIKMARYTPPVYLISTATEKAVKHDKAAVPTHLWDARVAFLLGIMKPGFFHRRAFNLLQETMLRRWQQNVRRSWEVWWESHHFMVQETEPWWSSLIQARGREACLHADQATFWNWNVRSVPFFWRWPPEFQTNIALGLRPMWTHLPCRQIDPQHNLGDQATLDLIREKIDDVQAKRYVVPKLCLATMNYFSVPKGDSDVRMVYNGTKSGLNESLYAPWFPLPDSEGLTRTLESNYWCVDNDYGGKCS
ncbi:hypothetical protein ACA910_017989 [Epithemia clementina (nom. ined.)]